MNKESFKLRQLLNTNKSLWLLAWLLGVVTVLSVLGLVVVSGWFISMAAVAGVVALGSHVFNYFMPSALIRLFAITRTVARYGDLMVSHHAVFALLKELRVRFFAMWAKQPFIVRTVTTESSSQKMQRLVKDIDILDEFTLRLLSPWVVATVAVFVLVLVLALIIPFGWLAGLPLLLILMVAGACLWLGIKLAKTENQLTSQRKALLLDTLPALTQLLIWQKWHYKINQIHELDDKHASITHQAQTLRRVAGVLIQMLIALAVVVLLILVARFFATTQITPFTAQTLNAYAGLNRAFIADQFDL